MNVIRNYVTTSRPGQASIVRGPVHPLVPPPPPRHPARPPPHDDDDDIQITHHPARAALTIHSESLNINRLTLSYLFLRDLCQSSHSVDPRTRQKLFKASDIPVGIHPLDCSVLRDPNGRPSRLSITWSHRLEQNSDHFAHLQPSDYSFDWLKKLAQPHALEAERHRLEFLKPTLWSSRQSQPVDSDLKASDSNWIERLLERKDQLVFNYADVVKKDSHDLQKEVLGKLNEFGLVLFDGLQSSRNRLHYEEEDEFKLKKLIDGLGIDVRRTFYGDLWDVFSAGQQAKNVANTNLPLDFHMDLVHFENPPRFQFLHCIKNQVEGGISGFLDSYSVAYRLLLEDPEAFETLTRELIGFEYINNHHHTFFKHPTIQLKNSSNLDELKSNPDQFLDSIQAINYSPPFQSPFYHLKDQGRLGNLFKALQKFESFFNLSDDSDGCKNPLKFEILLKPGQVVAFDNRRVLHARSAFTAQKPSSTITSSNRRFDQVDRWLKGAYVDGDSVWDRIRVLNPQ